MWSVAAAPTRVSHHPPRLPSVGHTRAECSGRVPPPKSERSPGTAVQYPHPFPCQSPCPQDIATCGEESHPPPPTPHLHPPSPAQLHSNLSTTFPPPAPSPALPTRPPRGPATPPHAPNMRASPPIVRYLTGHPPSPTQVPVQTRHQTDPSCPHRIHNPPTPWAHLLAHPLALRARRRPSRVRPSQPPHPRHLLRVGLIPSPACWP